jgi:hypothetical protein
MPRAVDNCIAQSLAREVLSAPATPVSGDYTQNDLFQE